MCGAYCIDRPCPKYCIWICVLSCISPCNVISLIFWVWVWCTSLIYYREQDCSWSHCAAILVFPSIPIHSNSNNVAFMPCHNYRKSEMTTRCCDWYTSNWVILGQVFGCQSMTPSALLNWKYKTVPGIDFLLFWYAPWGLLIMLIICFALTN